MVRTKLLLSLGIVMGLADNVFAQLPHAYYSDVVLSTKGTPVPGASVLVYETGTKVKGKLFKGESAGTTKFASFLDFTSATHDVSSTGWNLSGQQAFADASQRAAWIDTDDLNGEKNTLHLTKPEGYETLGQRYVKAAVELVKAK